jgi:DNA-binding LacI/PurR family transcriptional regulator
LMLGLGHQSAVFISAQHRDEYSRQRLDGFRDQYAKAGLHDAIHPVISDQIDLHLLHVLAASGLDDPLLRKVIAVDRTESQTNDQFNALIAFKEGKQSPVVDPKSALILKRNLAIVNDLDARNLDKGFFSRMVTAALTEAGSLFIEASLAPLFKQALTYKNATAWICATDSTALSALRFLKQQSIEVPGKISVTGFDNEPFDAVEQRLTTFDFNAQGFVHGILNFIVRPPRHRGPYRHAPVEIEGIIIERGTTGKAKSA